MDTVLWIVTGVMAAAGFAGALGQILIDKERYRSLAASQRWVDDFSERHLRVIGVVKLVGVVGLVAPPLTGIAPVLSPVAACGLALFMAGAATTRFRRNEWGYMAGDVAFLAVYAFIAWGRFVLAPYG